MAEYIERDKILGYMDLVVIHARGVAGNDSILKKVTDIVENMRDLVAEAPAADVQTVVHGRWEVVHGVLTPGGDPLLRCPICKARESEHLCGVECRTVWNYCPNCGARMKEGL